jgi:ElaA protein
MNIKYECLPFKALSLEQLYTIMALRQEVFVVEQHCPYLDADGNDQVAHHLMGYDEQGRLATYVRILPVGVSYKNHASIGRVITAPFARGQRLGRPLMQTAIEQLSQLYGAAIPIKLSAQAHLQGYYGSVGFEAVGEMYLEDGIPHVGMVRKV